MISSKLLPKIKYFAAANILNKGLISDTSFSAISGTSIFGFPSIFILYMKQDYIFKTDKTSLHFSRDKTKNFRTLKNQSYVDNLIWWNTLYILLLFIIIGFDRYISSPLYMQLIKKSLIILK